MKKADYSRIADSYDDARVLGETNLQWWLDAVAEHIGDRSDIDLLDLGCGTGRFAIPFACRLGYRVTGADGSAEMLAKARCKEGADDVEWHEQDASCPSYPDGRFDVVFMSHLLHHLDNPFCAITEGYRVLRPEGIIMNRYGALEHLGDSPEQRFFPGVREIDEARTPTTSQIEQWFAAAGFTAVESQSVKQRTFATPAERMETIEKKGISVLTLINEDDFERGLAAARDYLADHPDDERFTHDTLTLTVGRKPPADGL